MGPERTTPRTETRQQATLAPVPKADVRFAIRGKESAAKRRLVEQAQMPRPNHRLDARPNAEHRAGLFQVLLDCALGDPEDLAGIARALARFSPAQAFELATTEDHQVPPYSGGRYFKLKHTHDAPRARNSRTTLPQELQFNKHNHGATQTGGLSATSWRGIRHLLTAHLHCAYLPRPGHAVAEREKLVLRHPTSDLDGCPALRVAAPKQPLSGRR